MTKTKLATSAHVTACPHCDSGNISLADNVCNACHKPLVAKPSRKAAPKGEQAAKAAPAAPTLAAQLAAAVTVAPKAKTATPRSAPTTMLAIVKEFAPRTNQLVEKKHDNGGNYPQQANWIALKAAIAANGGKIGYMDAVNALLAAAKAGGYPCPNARGFVQARVRNGHIAPVAAQ